LRSDRERSSTLDEQRKAIEHTDGNRSPPDVKDIDATVQISVSKFDMKDSEAGILFLNEVLWQKEAYNIN